MLRAFKCTVLLCALFATQAFGQVRVDTHLQKDRYLQGEPIIVVVDIRNVGDDAFGYDKGNLNLTVPGGNRRLERGCHFGFGFGSAAGWVDHPPMLPPGEQISFRYVLKGYNLRPGTYDLTISGRVAVRWKYYTLPSPNAPAPPPPKHKETDPVSGAEFQQTLSLSIATATEEELRNALATLISDADSADTIRRYDARAAIIESAPAFLTELIGRFATEAPSDGSAIDALGRIATAESRLQLRSLLVRGNQPSPSIVLAVARMGDQNDAEFLNRVLLDGTAQEYVRSFAALGLGQIGGDRVVEYLEDALPTASPEVRHSIANALGHSRSRKAVPVLIDLFGQPLSNEVCGGLKTLTRRTWCDGSVGSSADTKRKWRQWWDENGAAAPVYGPDDCAEVVEPLEPWRPILAARSTVDPTSEPGTPTIGAVQRSVASPGSYLMVSGSHLGLEDYNATTALFIRDGTELIARKAGSRRSLARDANGNNQDLEVIVPDSVAPGLWQLVIENRKRRSAPFSIEVVAAESPVLTGVSPPRPHPGQLILLAGAPRFGDQVELIDGQGKPWRIGTGSGASDSVILQLPDDVADGEATVRVLSAQSGMDRFSAPFRFFISSAPLPLTPAAIFYMKPVAPGQSTDLARDYDVEFELARVDRVDVEFRQGDLVFTTQPGGANDLHVQVPSALAPGSATVRTRTWIEQTASDWSAPASLLIPERPVGSSITVIEVGSAQHSVWLGGDTPPAVVAAKPSDVMTLHGHFPVARTADLLVQLTGTSESRNLSATDVDSGVKVELPRDISQGDWRLVIGSADGVTPRVEVITVRVM